VKKLEVLRSTQDPSVNFVERHLEGFLESRYVRRHPDYFICYLSSHNGCNRGCGFCHLTVTGQTQFEAAGSWDFREQARVVFQQYLESEQPAKWVSFNFMARGEPLSNMMLTAPDWGYNGILSDLSKIAARHDLPAKFNISTIIPQTFRRSLADCFPIITPTIYYSAYSANADFRKKWLPAAAPLKEALRLLKDYQDFSKKLVKIHHCLIAGENDSRDDARELCSEIQAVGLHCGFNLVRYNPATPEQGREPCEDVINRYMATMDFFMPGRVKEIRRVGFDVKASCGMFHE